MCSLAVYIEREGVLGLSSMVVNGKRVHDDFRAWLQLLFAIVIHRITYDPDPTVLLLRKSHRTHLSGNRGEGGGGADKGKADSSGLHLPGW